MDELKDLISTINFTEPYNYQGHQDIWSQVEKLSTTNVPHFLVFYAARNILYPSFIIEQIPDLLNLLTPIETFRRFAVLKADEALQLQKHFEYEKIHGSAKDVRLLSADEVRALQLFVDQKDTQRRAYILLVGYLIQHYIHYLWTAPESCSPARRLDDFFPGSMNGFNVPSKLHFHVDLSEDEKLYFGQLKLEIREWLDLVLDWESKREQTCRQEGLSDKEMSENFANDFQVKFPPPHKPSELAINVEFCMKEVEDMIRLLEQWFPPHSGS